MQGAAQEQTWRMISRVQEQEVKKRLDIILYSLALLERAESNTVVGLALESSDVQAGSARRMQC